MLSMQINLQNLIKFNQFVLKILSGNEILTSIKGHNSVTRKFVKIMRNNPNLDLVSIQAHAKLGQIPLIRSQDIGWKQNSDINQGP